MLYCGEYFHVNENVIIPRSFLGEILQTAEKRFQKYSLQDNQNPNHIYPKSLNANGDIPNEEIPVAYEEEDAFEDTDANSVEENDEIQLFDFAKVHSLVDLCTGSGCLAIIASRMFPNVKRVHAAGMVYIGMFHFL